MRLLACVFTPLTTVAILRASRVPRCHSGSGTTLSIHPRAARSILTCHTETLQDTVLFRAPRVTTICQSHARRASLSSLWEGKEWRLRRQLPCPNSTRKRTTTQLVRGVWESKAVVQTFRSGSSMNGQQHSQLNLSSLDGTKLRMSSRLPDQWTRN